MRGRGPEVAGEGEALLIAGAGRRDAVKDLRGPGTDKLATRMYPTSRHNKALACIDSH